MAGRGGNGRRKLANIPLDEYSSAGTTKQCMKWKRSVNITRQLHGLTDQELALLVEDLEGSAALEMVAKARPSPWKEHFAHERLDEA